MLATGVFVIFSTVFVCVQIFFSSLSYLFENFWLPWLRKPINFKTYGKWALVTGATDGIGKEYARQLAQKGLNIILVSRTLAKLENVAEEIRETFGVKTAVIDVDFTSSDIYNKIKDCIKGKEIGILVNNVGMCYSTPDYFLEYPEREKFIKDLINCNILSMTMMCSIILPQMVQRSKGIVINLGSTSTVIPAPNLTMYSGSKAFIEKFSDDLAAEYENNGIIMQFVQPGFVASNMTKMEKGFIVISSSKDFVHAALKTVGFAKKTHGLFTHYILKLFLMLPNYLSPSLYRVIAREVLKYHRNRHIRNGIY